jgi:signal peptide peptidase SppA
VKYPHIAARIFNAPLLIHPQKLDAIIAGLGPRVLGVLQGDIRADGADAIAPADMLAPELFSTRKGDRVKEAGWPGYRNVDGVAVVSANGALVHKTTVDMNTSSMLVGYNDLAASVEHAMSNDDIHAVLMVWDSPGGEVQGAFEFADRIAAAGAGATKLFASIADGMAASAAYLGGSAKGKPYVTATGYAGSIGVVMRHVDYSSAMAKEGVGVDYIFAGAHKVDGNPFSRMSPEVRASLQAEVNNLYDMFVSAVARNTGISAEAIRATEARTYMGQAAVEAGLAQGVTTTDALISELAGARARVYPAGPSGTGQAKGNSMTAPNAAPVLTQADIDKARAEGLAQGRAEAQAEARAAGVKEGADAAAKAERERAAGIMAHKEADGRAPLAAKCVAMGLTVDQAGEMLATSPKQAAGQGATFNAAMAATGNPGVKAGEPEDGDQNNPQAISASWDRAFGVETKPARKH